MYELPDNYQNAHCGKIIYLFKKSIFFLQINFEFSRLNIKLIFMNFHGKKKKNLKWIFGQKNSFAAVCKT